MERLRRAAEALFSRPHGAAVFGVALGCGLTIAALVLALLFVLAVTLHGCGYSESDMQLQRDRVELLRATLDKCEAAARSSAAAVRDCRPKKISGSSELQPLHRAYNSTTGGEP